MKQSRSRGASRETRDIYDALWENRHTALTRDQLLDECVRRFNRSGIMEWYIARQQKRGLLLDNESGAGIVYKVPVSIKMASQLKNMVQRGEVVNHGTKHHPLYSIADPPRHPKLWQPRVYRPGGFREYNPDEERAIVARHALGMRWPAEARAELARPRPRNAELVRLIEDALTLLDD